MITWTKESLEEFLANKQERSVGVDEYLLLISFINKIRPKILIDIGTFKGSSGYILGTCCDSIEKIYSIDNINNNNYCEKEGVTKEEHGIYLPKEAIFLKEGYEVNLPQILSLYKPEEVFIFWDAGKNSMKVNHQLMLSWSYGIKYIAVHDSGEQQKTVKRVIKHFENEKIYKIIKEDIVSNPKKGVSILELVKN